MSFNFFFILFFPLFGTVLGSIFTIFFRRNLSSATTSLMAGFSSGVMMAASIFSLLIPSIEMSEGYEKLKFLPATIGFVLGILFLNLICRAIGRLKVKNVSSVNLAVGIHNIPEGMAIGALYAYAIKVGTPEAYFEASSLALGIGIQNIPEGAIVSIRDSVSGNKIKALLKGLLSGVVEPISIVVTILFYNFFNQILPYSLAFASSAMIYVILDELVYEGMENKNKFILTFTIGFIIMMVLDVFFS